MMDAERLAFGANSFDLVLCSFAFLSISDKQRALVEFRRVLAPGARVGVLDAFGWFFEHDSRWEWQTELLASHGVLGNHRTAEDGRCSKQCCAMQVTRLCKSRMMHLSSCFETLTSGGGGSGPTAHVACLKRCLGIGGET